MNYIAGMSACYVHRLVLRLYRTNVHRAYQTGIASLGFPEAFKFRVSDNFYHQTGIASLTGT